VIEALVSLDHHARRESDSPGGARSELPGDRGPADDLSFVRMALDAVDLELGGEPLVAGPVAEVVTCDVDSHVAHGAARSGFQPADADRVVGGAELLPPRPGFPAACAVRAMG